MDNHDDASESDRKLTAIQRILRGDPEEDVAKFLGVTVECLTEWLGRVETEFSECGRRLWKGYQSLAGRELGQRDIAYLIIEGISARLRLDGPCETALAAWGITAKGDMVLLSLSSGSKEDHDAALAFLNEMRSRGLKDPLLVVSDGTAGIVKAVRTHFPRSAHQLCLDHRMQELAGKLPTVAGPEFMTRASEAYRAATHSRALDLAEEVEADFRNRFPGAVAAFLDDLDACIAYLHLPKHHRETTCFANRIERLFVEDRRKMEIVHPALGDKMIEKLVFAAMNRAVDEWKAIRVSKCEQEQMFALRKRLDSRHEARIGSGFPGRKPEPTCPVKLPPGIFVQNRIDTAVTIDIDTAKGEPVTIIIPGTRIPVNVTLYAKNEDIITSPNFKRCQEDGRFRVLSHEEFCAFMTDKEAVKEELRQLEWPEFGASKPFAALARQTVRKFDDRLLG